MTKRKPIGSVGKSIGPRTMIDVGFAADECCDDGRWVP